MSGTDLENIGRGSWIRTNDLQYPKLPRYQAALYPDHLGNDVDTRLGRNQQGVSQAAGTVKASVAVKEWVAYPVSRRDTVFPGGAGDHLQHPLCQAL